MKSFKGAKSLRKFDLYMLYVCFKIKPEAPATTTKTDSSGLYSNWDSINDETFPDSVIKVISYLIDMSKPLPELHLERAHYS